MLPTSTLDVGFLASAPSFRLNKENGQLGGDISHFGLNHVFIFILGVLGEQRVVQIFEGWVRQGALLSADGATIVHAGDTGVAAEARNPEMEGVDVDVDKHKRRMLVIRGFEGEKLAAC